MNLRLRDPERSDDTGSTAPNGVPPARTLVRISRRHLWMMIIAGVLLLALGVWLVIAKLPQLLGTPGPSEAENTAQPAAAERRILATLYYVSPDGAGLVAARGTAVYGATPAEQARHIVESQIQAAPEGQQSAIPAGTTVRTVFLTQDGRAYVDLGGTITSGHTGGSLNEALAVYAIVNALTVNLPNVSAVQILIEGQQVDTLAGHLDLRYPLSKTLEWVRKGP